MSHEITPPLEDHRTERAGALPRRPTADPNRFLIPAEALPGGFAERLVEVVREPTTPLPAATVVLVRERSSTSPVRAGVETMMLRRHGRSGFAADAWVFPGGIVDPEDRDPALAALCDGPPPEAWARRLGVGDPGVAFGYLAAALREAFEETGILLARWPEEVRASEVREVSERLRGELLANRVSLRELAEATGVRYSLTDWIYVAHWITPEPEPRRYDTYFFVAPVPPRAECEPHAPELVEAQWSAPADAVERFATGEMKMLPPTVHTLRRLAGYSSIAELTGALRDAPVPTYLPTMRRSPEGVIIEIE